MLVFFSAMSGCELSFFFGTFYAHDFHFSKVHEIAGGFTGALLCLKNSSNVNSVAVTWLLVPSIPAGQPPSAAITLPHLLKKT